MNELVLKGHEMARSGFRMMHEGINLLITEDKITFGSEADYENFLKAMRAIETIIGKSVEAKG